MTNIALKEEEQVQPRKVGEELPDLNMIDPGVSQYRFDNITEYVEFAKIMAQGGPMLPKHAQSSPAICLAITMRAVHWGFDPFALALETYQAKDGQPIAYQARVFTSVLIKNGIHLEYEFTGETHFTNDAAKSTKGNQVASGTAQGTRQVTARAEVDGKVMEYTTPMLKDIKIKNSPLWHNDPDQQLSYYAGRAWARRYRPDLMMGAQTPDEVQAQPIRDITPKSNGFASMGEKAREKAAEAAPEALENQTGDTVEGETVDGPQIDPESPPYLMGIDAAKEGFITIEDSPLKNDPEANANWEAGFRSVEQ